VDVRRSAHSQDPSLEKLGAGERDAIDLAVELHGDLLRMDDQTGVIAARGKGLEVIGTLAVLALAAQDRLVNLADAFDRIKRTNFRYRQENHGPDPRRTGRQGVTPETAWPLYNRVMDLRPLHDRVLVTRLDEAEQKIGGIIIPDTAKEKPQQAEVHAVGNGKLLETGERIPLEVKAGDRILFGKYSGSEIKIEGREYLILKEDEILGVLE
jgi:chaperonin GroES